jgi:hypothetical protein
LIAVVVALWGVAAVTAVMEEGIHQSRQAPLQGVRRHDEVACPRPGGSADLVGDVKVVRGAIGFADTKHLVLDVSEGEPKSYVFAMASATVRVSGKEGGVGISAVVTSSASCIRRPRENASRRWCSSQTPKRGESARGR